MKQELTRPWRRLSSVVLSVGCALLVGSTPARADSTCAGISLPDHVLALGVNLLRNGMGVRRATIFKVHVYVAGLYLEQRTRSATDALKIERARLLVLRFVRDVDHDELVEAIHSALEKNAGASYAAMSKQMRAFEHLLPALREGTALALAYRPGQGLEVRGDSKLRGVIHDDAFANMLFRAWLGPYPPDAALKAGLLGGPCD